MFIYTQNYKILFQLSLTFTKLCLIKRDHLVNHLVIFYILVEKRENCEHFNSITDHHKIWHDDAERVLQVHWLSK